MDGLPHRQEIQYYFIPRGGSTVSWSFWGLLYHILNKSRGKFVVGCSRDYGSSPVASKQGTLAASRAWEQPLVPSLSQNELFIFKRLFQHIFLYISFLQGGLFQLESYTCFSFFKIALISLESDCCVIKLPLVQH